MLPAGTQLGRYQIEKPISDQGGMGSIFLASVVDNPRLKVAIKIARTDLNRPTAEDVFLQREAELLCKWDWRHTGILRLFPIPRGDSENYVLRAVELKQQPWYMVMEYLRGQSLAECLKRIERYPIEWKLELFYQILTAISFMHQKGYAHRDLKPENIVFREPISVNEIPQPVLIDFALSTNGFGDYSLMKKCYTTEYAAPEILIGSIIEDDELIDLKPSDIWSLGIILFEIITGNRLFKGNRDRIRETITTGIIDVSLGSYKSHIQLGSFIKYMLSRRPENRPTVDLVIAALEGQFLPPRIIVQ